MNKRLRKKLKKRLGYKSYKNYGNLISTDTGIQSVYTRNHRVYPRDVVNKAINDYIKNNKMPKFKEEL